MRTSRKKLITEAQVLAALRAGETELEVEPGTLITPLARDTAREKGVRFVTRSIARLRAEPHAPVARMLALGSDHGGYAYKEALRPFLESLGWQVIDLGTYSDRPCDYPRFAYAVARTVALGYASLGIMIDGAGIGSAIACNKVPGIRAACAYNEFTAWNARAHNNAHILTLGSRSLGIEVCKRIARIFLETPFEGGRHERRVRQIAEIEQAFLQEV